MEVKKNNYSSFLPRTKHITAALLQNTPPAYRSNPDFGILPVDAPPDCYELIQKRTPDARYYVKNNSDGKTFFIQKASGPINYYDDNHNLRAIDFFLHPGDTTGIYTADAQPMPVTIDCRSGYTSLTVDHYAFRYNHNLQMEFEKNGKYIPVGVMQYGDHTAGMDGVYITDAWKNVDAEIAVRQGAIKTNFILRDKSMLDPDADYLVFSEYIPLGKGYVLQEDKDKGYVLPNGLWKGDVILRDPQGLEMLRIQRPLILDQQKIKTHPQDQVEAVAYELVPVDSGCIFRIVINMHWLLAADREFPVIIDPTLTGTATYTASDIGFQFDNLCWNDAEYCSYFLDVDVPGKTTLTDAYFDATYYSENFGCYFTTDCLMKEAAFRIIGPCDDSPSPTSFWTCLPPAGDTAGTCYGIGLNMFNTVSCTPPQCDDYHFTFEMRTYMCSCTKPPCDITCHYMPSGSWVITIEGQTVEENAIISSSVPDFTICAGDTIDLYASGQLGVPPYTYEWLPGGLVTDTLLATPDSTTTYTSVIHDLCDNTDTVTQLVTVHPLPQLAPGPFEGCYTVTAHAGSGYVSYVWSTGQTGESAQFDSSGTYYVTVTDINGCSNISAPVVITIDTAPVIDAYPDTIYVSDGALGMLNVTTSSTGDVSYNWYPSDDISCPTCPSTFVYSAGPVDVYYVTGEEKGCISDPDSIIVIVSENSMYIPNAFTPNGDGLNDVFHILNPVFYPKFELQIFNRWGQAVFSSDDILQGWDGTYQGVDQEVGTYVWIITYEKENEPGKIFTLKGDITLLR